LNNNKSNNNNFIITDDSSQFAQFLPEKWIEPLAIIAKIKDYEGIDEYILELVEDRLEMFVDTRDNLEDEFQQYMHNTIKGKDVPNEYRRNEDGKYINQKQQQEEKL
jgi:hypothetical protein